jgi:predicted GNAT family acetyltransferase
MYPMTTPPSTDPVPEITVTQEDDGRRGGFVAERDGRTLGEMDYSRPQADLMIIEHTEVSGEARGAGVGRLLVDAAVAWARREHARIMPLCPYARSVFAKDASIRDVLAQ